jgi:glycosyltransferase involved in cell wall biosynthesis
MTDITKETQAKRPKVLYLFAGKRKEFYSKWKKGLVPDTQLLGLNYMSEFGIDANFVEWPLSEWIRHISFNLVHIPYIFAIRSYDVVFICAGLPLVFLTKCVLRMKRPKFIIYNTFLTNALSRNHGLSKYVIRKAIENIDMIVCTAATQRDFLIKNGFDDSKIVFEPIGIDAHFFENKVVTGAPKYIASVGRDLGRDYKTFFEAVRDLPVQVKVATKKETLVGLTIPENVEVLYHVPYEAIPSFYKNAYVAVIPLRDASDPTGSDTSGQYGYLEPMASGVPVIVTDKDTVREYIESGKDGILVPPNDANILRDAIKNIIENEQLRKMLTNAAQKKVRAQFTSRRFAEKISALIKKLA